MKCGLRLLIQVCFTPISQSKYEMWSETNPVFDFPMGPGAYARARFCCGPKIVVLLP